MPGGLTVQYTYNGDGLKIRRIEGSTVTRYYHDGIRPIYEAQGDGSLQAQLERDIFGNLLAAQNSAGTRVYFHHDGLGSTVALTNASGAVAGQRTYDAWGNRRTSSGSAPGNYQFTGAELDPTSGLYHMGARFYDPTIGRWLSEDPSQDKPFEPATLNFYAYVHNNPMYYVDSDGRSPRLPFLFELAALLGALLASQTGGTPAGIQRALAIGAAGVAAVAKILAQTGEFFQKATKYLDTPLGRRLFDLIVRVGGKIKGIEVKAGFVGWTDRIQQQIAKDAYILANKAQYGIQEITWYIEEGKVDLRVLKALQDAGIHVVFY